MPSPLDLAKAARDRGWRPIPLHERSKLPAGPWEVKAASEPTDQMLALWFGGDPRNVGVACKRSGLLVVDADRERALEDAAADSGQTLPLTYRVRTRKGWHWYFDATEHPDLGNSPGRLADYGCDVRGGGSTHGGYVVAAGSTHESGHVYAAEDEHVAPAPLPDWVAELIGQQQPREALSPEVPTSPLNPAKRTAFTRSEADACVQGPGRRFTESVEGGQNNALNELCMALGHFVETDDRPGHWSRRDAERWAEDAARENGYAQRDPTGMRATIRSGLEAGMRDRWPCIVAGSEPSAAAADDPIAQRVADEVLKLQIMHQARRQFAELERASRPRLTDGLIDVRDLAQVAPPEMLMAGLIQRAGIGFLAGKWGSYKTFLAVSFACHLATGTPWQGREEFAVPQPVRVLYVASEGASGVAERVRAWERVHDDIPAGMLAVYPRPVRLNSDAQVAELDEIIAAHGFSFVVIDTYHRSAPGTEENSATEFGVVYEAVAALRDKHGTSFMFNDHTGHTGTRPRGSSAKADDADFILLADVDGEDRSATAQRTLRVMKLKDAEVRGEWPIRLRLVAESGAKGSAIVELGTAGASAVMFDRDLKWWLDEVPTPLAERFNRQAGRSAALDICRILNAINDEDGETPDGLRKVAEAGPRRHSISTWKAGLALVKRTGVVGQGSTSTRLVLHDPWPVERAE
ncbi:DNA helicase, phage-associated [Pseudonocardia sp. N23]|nr:DNA helicase, phage-associated [Pseudonocardia sp. N23]